jgi:hypothetical protein
VRKLSWYGTGTYVPVLNLFSASLKLFNLKFDQILERYVRIKSAKITQENLGFLVGRKSADTVCETVQSQICSAGNLKTGVISRWSGRHVPTFFSEPYNINYREGTY